MGTSCICNDCIVLDCWLIIDWYCFTIVLQTMVFPSTLPVNWLMLIKFSEVGIQTPPDSSALTIALVKIEITGSTHQYELGIKF